MVVVTLLFMFYLSWRLSLVAFISVPAIVIVSKWYGEYIRKLSKLSQDKLAEAGSVAEESLSSMSTVRSFAAEGRESKEYAKKLQDRTPNKSHPTVCTHLIPDTHRALGSTSCPRGEAMLTGSTRRATCCCPIS
ncbi:unnamed protein product [Ectocarpus sp. 8 AP-2014]